LPPPQRQLVEAENGPGATAEGYVAWWPKSFEVEYGPLPHYVPPPPKRREQAEEQEAGSSERGAKRVRETEEEAGASWTADPGTQKTRGTGKGGAKGGSKGAAKGSGKGDSHGKPAKEGKEKVFQYGNYPRYYQYRVSNVFPGGEDPRLGLFESQWFEGKVNAQPLTLAQRGAPFVEGWCRC